MFYKNLFYKGQLLTTIYIFFDIKVEVVRTHLGREHCPNIRNSENATELTQSLKEKDPLYIVIDTNVFLSNLEVVEKARDAQFKSYPRPFIVIPWTVIRVSIKIILQLIIYKRLISVFSE